MSELSQIFYSAAIFGMLWVISGQLNKILAALKRDDEKKAKEGKP